ncbi:MAG: hypothetical protein K0S37_4202, partial [Microbacterium sp.]|nr:hypothetical protein [Microbacterium sp.]
MPTVGSTAIAADAMRSDRSLNGWSVIHLGLRGTVRDKRSGAAMSDSDSSDLSVYQQALGDDFAAL